MLKTELGVVQSNLTMMSDMMSQLDPVTVKQADMELLQVNKEWLQISNINQYYYCPVRESDSFQIRCTALN